MTTTTKTVCAECNGTGTLTRLGGDWGAAKVTTVPCWRCAKTQTKTQTRLNRSIEFVEFDVSPLEPRVIVRIEEAQAFHDDKFHHAGAEVTRVFWRGQQFDEGQQAWTFAKSWIYRDTQRISRIGVGAYGDGFGAEFAHISRPSETLRTYSLPEVEVTGRYAYSFNEPGATATEPVRIECPAYLSWVSRGVGAEVAVEAGAPGTGRIVYRITRVTDTAVFGVVLSDTVCDYAAEEVR